MTPLSFLLNLQHSGDNALGVSNGARGATRAHKEPERIRPLQTPRTALISLSPNHSLYLRVPKTRVADKVRLWCTPATDKGLQMIGVVRKSANLLEQKNKEGKRKREKSRTHARALHWVSSIIRQTAGTLGDIFHELKLLTFSENAVQSKNQANEGKNLHIFGLQRSRLWNKTRKTNKDVIPARVWLFSSTVIKEAAAQATVAHSGTDGQWAMVDLSLSLALSLSPEISCGKSRNRTPRLNSSATFSHRRWTVAPIYNASHSPATGKWASVTSTSTPTVRKRSILSPVDRQPLRCWWETIVTFKCAQLSSLSAHFNL